MPSFRSLGRFTAGLSLCLGAILLCAPFLIFWLFGIESHASAAFLGRRTAFLFLGLGVIAWAGSTLPPSKERRWMAFGYAFMMLGLALLGCAEFYRGAAGPGIFVAVGAETLLALAFLNDWKRPVADSLARS